MNPIANHDRPQVRVLLSGGIDSAACVQFYLGLGRDVSALHISYGQAAGDSEKASALAIAAHYGIALQCVGIGGLKIPSSGEIAGRNSMLLSVALVANGTEPRTIAIGVHAGTRYYDCQPNFIQTWGRLLDGYTDGRVLLGVPFLTWSKGAIYRFCIQESVPIGMTWSCEASSGVPCGRCLSCKDREVLLARA